MVKIKKDLWLGKVALKLLAFQIPCVILGILLMNMRDLPNVKEVKILEIKKNTIVVEYDETLGDIEITLLDKSSLAIQVAKINAQKLQINANFVISDVLLNYFGDQRYDIILCNPPYIETDVIDTLEPEVKNYEPKIALDGGKDGLLFYNALAKNLKENLNPNSKVFFEIGYNQGSIVEEIYKNENFKVELLKDYGNNDRCVVVSL